MLVSIAVLAIYSVKALYLVLAGPGYTQPQSIEISASQNNSKALALDVGMLARMSPFSGKTVITEIKQPKLNQPDAPETELNMVLNGVRADGRGAGVAFISTGKNEQKRYVVGDEIVGLQGVSIESIYADGVLISRNGRVERLSNRHDKDIGIQSVQPRKSRISNSIPTVEEARVARESSDTVSSDNTLKEEVQTPLLASSNMSKRDIEDLLSWARWDENTIGNVPGVTVFPLDGARFARSGLKARDIVQKIAGISVNNIGDFEALRSSLETATKVKIELIRGNRNVELTVNVGQ